MKWLLKLFRRPALALVDSAITAALVPLRAQVDGVESAGGYLSPLERELTEDELAVANRTIDLVAVRIRAEIASWLSGWRGNE